MRQTVPVHVIVIVAGFAFLALIVTACQAPAGGSADPPTTSPVAPAVEPTHPDAERTIPFPTSPAPVAPAVESEHPDAEQTIPLPTSHAPVAPAIQPEHPDAERTIPLPSE
jgi:hypothetical protein